MFHRLIPAAALAVLGLALPLFTSSTAQAGPPDRTLHVMQPGLDNSCVALIEWQPLQGGKPIYANVILKYLTANGTYTTVLADGASAYHKVKQNAGSLTIDFGPIAAQAPADSYQLEVNFVDNRDQPLSEVFKTTSDCDGA
jgi:hypothetical protein